MDLEKRIDLVKNKANMHRNKKIYDRFMKRNKMQWKLVFKPEMVKYIANIEEDGEKVFEVSFIEQCMKYVRDNVSYMDIEEIILNGDWGKYSDDDKARVTMDISEKYCSCIWCIIDYMHLTYKSKNK